MITSHRCILPQMLEQQIANQQTKEWEQPTINATIYNKNRSYRIQLQKVISTIITVIPHVLNWEIQKTSKTHSKKLDFNIDKPETSLKKIDFNIINNFDEIDDKNDNIMEFSSNDLTDDVQNNIDHHNVNQKQTNHNSLYTLANNKLQLSSDLEDLDWNSTNSHKGELVIVYDNKVGNKTLRPREFYALSVRPNENGNGHLIYRLSTNQIVITKDYQTVPVPEDLDDVINKTDSYDNKSQVDN